MWKDLGESSQLVLGIAIGGYTLYQFASALLERRRQRRALIRTLHGELSYFLALAGSLAKRAEQAVAAVPGLRDETDFASPAEEKDSLPDSAVASAEWLFDRAERLAGYEFTIDVEQIGTMLNRRQVDVLMDFVDAHRRYIEILMTRALDLKAFPRKRGVLKRFASVVAFNVAELEKLKREFDTLARLLKLGTPPDSAAGTTT